MTLTQKVRKLDIFKKIPNQISQGTNIGGLISILTVLSITYFLYVQCWRQFNPQPRAQIKQDKFLTRNQMIINLDISFYRFPCEILSLDLQDIMMSHSSNIGSIKKYRINRQGIYLDYSDFELLRLPNPADQLSTARKAIVEEYGCRIIGEFTVKEVPGNFHISSHAYQSIFARLKAQGVLQSINITHTIHHLVFGNVQNLQTILQKHPQARLNILDAYRQTSTRGIKQPSYNYHIDIVPILYESGYSQIMTYQYTYNHNVFAVDYMPVVYFSYHIGGLVVDIREDGMHFGMFLIRLCAIVGGTYTLASFVDHALDRFIDRKKQYQLIK